MNKLNVEWMPEFGSIYTWFAADKYGRVSLMLNNCFGGLPKSLLCIDNFEELLDSMSEFVWEESSGYSTYPADKCGDFTVDLFSAWRFRENLNKEYVINKLKDEWAKTGKYSDANLAINKGLFIYWGVEGSSPGQDYPFGYEGETKMGDYFRYIVPTKFASVKDFPPALHSGLVVSSTLDFTVDRVLDNDKINDYFPAVFSPG
ncbi:hypothetical protein ACOZXQ_003975 [Cronobacter malonaticus]